LKDDSETSVLYRKLESACCQLAVLIKTTPSGPQLAAHRHRLDELSDQIENLQEKLANLSASYARQRAQQKRTAAELRQALPADAALVDLLEYDHFGWTKENKDKLTKQRRLTAFVVRRDRPVAWIDLGPSAKVDAAVEIWRNTYGTGDESQQAAATLRKSVWSPLEPSLQGAATVVISPDGELARFPWCALPGTTAGTYLIEQRAIAVLAVPQALPELLARSDQGAQPAPSILLVGDVDYGGDPGVLLASDRGRRAARDGAVRWDPLPGTRTEILSIADSFQQEFANGKLTQLRKAHATAAAVRALAPAYRYLHFATHGFFADPETRSALAAPEKPGMGVLTVDALQHATGFHPGLLSGIVLTGANLPPVDGKDDGILTALEVGELDLSNVELATLSACETGLGATAGGEGVLGLQRAFQVAGARATVTSLWKIHDNATRSLMIDFYENLWTKKMSKIEALRQAQLNMLRNGANRGEKFLPDHPPDKNHRMPPYYWAAFVLSGDWR
jgi:CHAT domain-containing protein